MSKILEGKVAIVTGSGRGLGKGIAKKLAEKGAKVVASNSDPKNTDENDNFFDDIYKMFTINRVAATRMINSNSKGRGTVSELLICNY